MPAFDNPTCDPPALDPADGMAPGCSAGQARLKFLLWPDIDASLLQEGRGAVPEFPLALLPQPWRDWVLDTARSAGAPADYVAQAVLGAVAGVCGAGVVAQVTPSWSEPLVLWQALLGGPSSGKSPVLAAVRKLLGPIEGALQKDDDKRRGRHAARAEPTDAAVDEAVVPVRIAVDETSVAALGDAVAANPRGVILWRDSLAGWLAERSPSGRRRNEASGDHAPWLEAWNAGEVALKRRSPGAPVRTRFAVSIIGGLPPDRLTEQLFAGDDGLAARFLYAWPNPPAYCPLKQRRPAADNSVMLHRIADAAGTPQAPLVLPFAAGAEESFDDFLAALHAEMHEAEGVEAGWLGKGSGTVARLAAILALLAWSGRASINGPPVPVGRQQMEDAVALWTGYFKPHARAVFNRAAPATDRERRARRVARWLRDCGKAEVSRKEVRREALGDTVTTAEADQVISRLAKAGFLRLCVSLSSPRGGRPTRRWSVNPALSDDADG
jgi:hypothetical protein